MPTLNVVPVVRSKTVSASQSLSDAVAAGDEEESKTATRRVGTKSPTIIVVDEDKPSRTATASLKAAKEATTQNPQTIPDPTSQQTTVAPEASTIATSLPTSRAPQTSTSSPLKTNQPTTAFSSSAPQATLPTAAATWVPTTVAATNQPTALPATNVPSTNSSASGESSLSTETIVGASVGSALLLISTLGIVKLYRAYKNRNPKEEKGEKYHQDPEKAVDTKYSNDATKGSQSLGEVKDKTAKAEEKMMVEDLEVYSGSLPGAVPEGLKPSRSQSVHPKQARQAKAQQAFAGHKREANSEMTL